MTCEEFQSQIEQRVDTAASEHLETCAACRALHYRHEQLRNSLAIVRDAAPEYPQSLDAAVMSAFRRETVAPTAPKKGIPARLAWAAIAAGVLIAASLFLVGHRKAESAGNQVHAPVPQSVVMMPAAVDATPKSVAHPGTRKAEAHAKRGTARPVVKRQPAETVAAGNAPADEFQSLMYCDALSCSGDMQMIRIQLPASDIHRFPPARPSNGFVQADVVVGSDGIARAIRIVR